MKPVLKVVLAIFIVLVLLSGGGMFFLLRGLEAGSSLTVNDINLSLFDDGIYYGGYKAGRWSNKVGVTIKDHKIIKIDVVKDVLFRKAEVTEDIINRVVEKQNTNVEVVSGATVTSKAYLKSIENALIK